MSIALNVALKENAPQLTVEIGAGRWIDKAAIGAVVTLIILWPLAITAAVGAWVQIKMTDKVFGFLGNYVERNTLSHAPQLTSANTVLHELQTLAELRDRGVLTEQEFETPKDKNLSAPELAYEVPSTYSQHRATSSPFAYRS